LTPLTNEQRDLAGANVRLACWIARRRKAAVRTIGWENVYEAAWLGLCYAAQTFDPARGIKFGTLAFRTIHTQISNEVRHFHRKVRFGRHPDGRTAATFTIDHVHTAVTYDDGPGRVDGDDWIASLPKDERNVIKLRLAGVTQRRIAARMHWTVWHVQQVQVRALARL
jgi:RNA polymerase sigma factor (sigma-70 family)